MLKTPTISPQQSCLRWRITTRNVNIIRSARIKKEKEKNIHIIRCDFHVKDLNEIVKGGERNEIHIESNIFKMIF